MVPAVPQKSNSEKLAEQMDNEDEENQFVDNSHALQQGVSFDQKDAESIGEKLAKDNLNAFTSYGSMMDKKFEATAPSEAAPSETVQ